METMLFVVLMIVVKKRGGRVVHVVKLHG